MGSAINPNEIKRYEVTEVYCHPDAKVDIVLVHGLNGNPKNTWTAPNGVFWPSQLLPASLKSHQARILVYGYNADVYTFGGAKSGPSSDMIHQHAQTLLANLALERKSEEVQEHPIIWVAHSLGGILVKRALELSFDLQGNHDDDLRSIFVSTFGVIFLGTPHTGADPAKWGMMLQGMVNALVPKKLFETHSQLVKTLMSNNETLQNINLRFLDLYPHRLRVCMVHEGHPTDLKGTKHLIVDQTAASPQLPDVQYFGIEATHSGMCKFESKNSPGFTNVSVTLRSWVQECPDFIQTRWEGERLLRRQKREDEIAQLQRMSGLSHGTPQVSARNTPDPGSVHNSIVIAKSPISIPPGFTEPDAGYFIKPSGFRPNSLFVGRESELDQMHKMLFDKKKRADGTSAVLLQSLPGGGKTHLARQYVYEHKDDFPGGIFWLRAKSETELAAGFWDIARRAALQRVAGAEDATGSLDDPEEFIQMVKQWLNNRHDWLMVLDGIRFANSAALRKFIPDSTNTSLIYTSTEKSVMGDHHFMNPQLIRLPLLSAREAQTLLLLELGRMEPFAKDDLKYSMELVQSMGFLPVVIHAVASRLKTTDEPLSKFARTYSSEPRLRGLGTYIAVVEQLISIGAEEALNLIHIICFFSQHIPVEMISLGLKALDVHVKSSEPVSGHSLNNTFKILNTFALIDRSDHEADIHSSQSSRGSSDMLADNVDVIRLHSVVQGFFLDTLHGDGTLLLWLDRAVRVFCCSYDMANERISRKLHQGLVEDYRLYEIHGIKIREHLTRHMSRRLSRDKKEIIEEDEEMLDERLRAIKVEIARRTPESSHVILGGKHDQFQTSIFDRASSSSDAGPETPGKFDGSREGTTAWGLDIEKEQYGSPARVTDDADFGRSAYYPLLMPEDPGYESDREGMRPKPSQRAGTEEPWERTVLRPSRAEGLPLHRTIKNPERPRYRDTGAYRATSAIDPRLSRDYAQGYLQKSPARAQSRGRLSGQSSAEVSLAQITQTSPPPVRGEGMIQDRRPLSTQPVERGRLTSRLPSYSTAVAGPTRDTVAGLREPASPMDFVGESESTASTERYQGSAIESLQRVFSVRSPASVIPPYPVTPYISSMSNNYFSADRDLSRSENAPSSVYPRLEGPPPVEDALPSFAAPTLPDRPTLLRQAESTPASLLASRPSISETNLFSLTSPDTAHPRSGSPGDGWSGLEPSHQGGYPMSRDPSWQSAAVRSTGSLELKLEREERGKERRSSVAATEPEPRLPTFSPRIAPTSFQVFESMRRRDELENWSSRQQRLLGSESRGGSPGRGAANRSPRLDSARAALIEKLDDWGQEVPNSTPPQPPKRPFNPTAPPFSPSSSSSNFTFSPAFPPLDPAPFVSSHGSLPSSPALAPYYAQPKSFTSSHPYPHPSSNTPVSNFLSRPNSPPMGAAGSRPGGAEMRRGGSHGSNGSASGGVKVRGRVIEFGDYPEPVDLETARERVVRSWRERERAARGERRDVGLGIVERE